MESLQLSLGSICTYIAVVVHCKLPLLVCATWRHIPLTRVPLQREIENIQEFHLAISAKLVKNRDPICLSRFIYLLSNHHCNFCRKNSLVFDNDETSMQ